jgi:hypothetical protein
VVGFTSLNLCGERVTTTASTPISSARARTPCRKFRWRR